MNRLTHKVDGKYYPSINNIVQQKGYDGSNYREFIHTKLGKLEDLMEKYNINSVEELDILINDHKRLYDKEIELSADLGMYQNENESLIKDIEKYWNIEQQLGCPIEIVFKALRDGIVLSNDKLYHCNLYFGDNGILVCYENGETVVGVSCKQYQKTWWLKGEKE